MPTALDEEAQLALSGVLRVDSAVLYNPFNRLYFVTEPQQPTVRYPYDQVLNETLALTAKLQNRLSLYRASESLIDILWQAAKDKTIVRLWRGHLDGRLFDEWNPWEQGQECNRIIGQVYITRMDSWLKLIFVPSGKSVGHLLHEHQILRLDNYRTSETLYQAPNFVLPQYRIRKAKYVEGPDYWYVTADGKHTASFWSPDTASAFVAFRTGLMKLPQTPR